MSEYDRISTRIAEGEAKRNKLNALERMLTKKVMAVSHPMQELELNYPTTKGKIYSEEEDRYLLCRLYHYGLQAEDVYERIKKDINKRPINVKSVQEVPRKCLRKIKNASKKCQESVQEMSRETTQHRQ